MHNDYLPQGRPVAKRALLPTSDWLLRDIANLTLTALEAQGAELVLDGDPEPLHLHAGKGAGVLAATDLPERVRASGRLVAIADTGADPVRAYAGACVRSSLGDHLGVLSIWDSRIREFTTAEQRTLQHLACLVAEGVTRHIEQQCKDEQRRQAEQIERDRNQILEMVARREDLYEIFSRLVGMVERNCPGVSCSLLLLEDGALYRATQPDEDETGVAADPVPLGEAGGCVGLAAATGAPVIRRCTVEAACTFGGAACRGCCHCVPIISASGDVVGALALHSSGPELAGETPGKLIESACHLAAIAIEHQQLNDRLAWQATHDSLTGLPNRVYLSDTLESAIGSARESESIFAVVFIDLDRFKQINDTLGHFIGDIVLDQVSTRMQESLDAGDFLARMGGDEFAAVFEGISSREEGIAKANLLLEAIRAPLRLNDYELFVTASVGVSFYPEDAEDAAALLRKAGSAMYRVKNRGTNDVECFTLPEVVTGGFERLELETYLWRALEQDELQLYYQPQVQLDGTLDGLEVLLAWEHPKLGRIPAGQFIPIAEESGLIVPIGSWVLRQACQQNAAWRREGLPGVRTAVNVSALQFARTDFVQMVSEALEISGLDPRLLELELTENLLMRDVEESARRMQSLRSLGVGISIDDFGIGYSSLNYLRRLPANTLKIDRTFLQEITAPSGTLPLIHTIVVLAHSMGLRVVAEGVETPQQLELLRMANCDLAQGHLFGGLLTPDEVRLRLGRRLPA